jgi:hypothetical protein
MLQPAVTPELSNLRLKEHLNVVSHLDAIDQVPRHARRQVVGAHDSEVVGRIALAEQHLSDRGGPDHTVPMQERELLVAQLGDVEWIGVADRESLHHAPLPRSFSARRPWESMGAVALPLPP